MPEAQPTGATEPLEQRHCGRPPLLRRSGDRGPPPPCPTPPHRVDRRPLRGPRIRSSLRTRFGGGKAQITPLPATAFVLHPQGFQELRLVRPRESRRKPEGGVCCRAPAAARPRGPGQRGATPPPRPLPADPEFLTPRSGIGWPAGPARVSCRGAPHEPTGRHPLRNCARPPFRSP